MSERTNSSDKLEVTAHKDGGGSGGVRKRKRRSRKKRSRRKWSVFSVIECKVAEGRLKD